MSDTSAAGATTALDLELRVREPLNFKTLGAVLVFAVSSLVAAPAAAGSPARVEHSFTRFCNQWMHKLALRERRNAARMQYVRIGRKLVGEYSGYARKPSSCQVQATGVAESPYVGKLTYRENVYRKSGRSHRTARRSDPRLLNSAEVLEIFRYNGRSWVY